MATGDLYNKRFQPFNVTITAGEALTQYDIVYADSTDSGEYKKADKDALATTDAVGIVLASISNAAVGQIAVGIKVITNGSWSWTPGGLLYLSGTPGAMTQTLPTTGYVKPLGMAITATQILFHPEIGYQAGDEIDADKLAIDWTPTNYTPTDVAETDSATQLSGQLKGIDLELATKINMGRAIAASIVFG